MTLNRLLRLLTLLGLGGCSFFPTNDKAKPLPEACTSQCKTPFGATLGTSKEGIPAYSNCSEKCVYLSPSKDGDTFLGIRWQCVEFGRRWLVQTKGLTYPSVDFAYQIWTQVKNLVEVKTKNPHPLTRHPNGSPQAPRPGDLLIYGKSYLGTGHIAIVDAVDLQKGTLAVIEQNYTNQPWKSHFSRKLTLEKRDTGFHIQEAHLLGWITY